MSLLSKIEVKSPQGCSSCLHEVSSLEFPNQECFLPLAPEMNNVSLYRASDSEDVEINRKYLDPLVFYPANPELMVRAST